MNEEQFRLLIERTPTLRDYFAAAALSGIFAGRGGDRVTGFHEIDDHTDNAAISAYAVADAMLRERNNDADAKPADIGTPPEFRD